MGKTFRLRDRDHRPAIQRAAMLAAIGSLTPADFCLGKTPITSRNDAVAEATRITRKRGRPFHSYKCPRCPFWHIAHTQEGEDTTQPPFGP